MDLTLNRSGFAFDAWRGNSLYGWTYVPSLRQRIAVEKRRLRAETAQIEHDRRQATQKPDQKLATDGELTMTTATKKLPAINNSTTISELSAAGYRLAIHEIGKTFAEDGAAIPLQVQAAANPGDLKAALLKARVTLDGNELRLQVGDAVVYLPVPAGLVKADKPEAIDNGGPIDASAPNARGMSTTAADRALRRRASRWFMSDAFVPADPAERVKHELAAAKRQLQAAGLAPKPSAADLMPTHIRAG